MQKFDDDDEYEFSCNSEAAINFWWPESLKPDNPRFMTEMRSLQIELIAGHSYLMNSADKARATKTVAYLRELNRRLPTDAGLAPAGPA